jgi:hypothetical protein
MNAVIDVDGKKAIVDPFLDARILEVGDSTGLNTVYSDYENTRATVLMAHATKNGRTVYYLYHWTRWEGERDRIEALTKEQALDWLMKNYHFAEESDIEAAEKYGLEVHETA